MGPRSNAFSASCEMLSSSDGSSPTTEGVNCFTCRPRTTTQYQKIPAEAKVSLMASFKQGIHVWQKIRLALPPLIAVEEHLTIRKTFSLTAELLMTSFSCSLEGIILLMAQRRKKPCRILGSIAQSKVAGQESCPAGDIILHKTAS